MARDGIADVTYVSPGYQPGRFPVIDAGNLPFMVSNAKEGTGAIDEWYRKYAGKEMKDVKFCFAFLHDPGTFHSKTKKIVVPGDVKGMKIRPAHATMATWVTQLGGTNVQASAPEVRDIIEKGVAEAVTFPWGSIPLFGIDKVTKYHMDAPLYVTSFVWVMNKAKYEQMSAAQKKVIDDHCTTQWAVRAASPWADFEHAGIKKLKAEPATRSIRSPTSSSPSGRRRPSRCTSVGRRREEGRRRSRRHPEGPQGGAGEVQFGVLIERAALPRGYAIRRNGGESSPPLSQAEPGVNSR